MGVRHAATASAVGCAVVGFDPDPVRCKSAEKAGSPALSSLLDALAPACAAIIATPPANHLDDLRAAVTAGVSALVEKPFADRAEGLAAILDAAEAGGLIFAVAQNLRFPPAVVEANALPQRGALGPVSAAIAVGAPYLPAWRAGSVSTKTYAPPPASRRAQP